MVYFGDTARLPYGTKSKQTVIRYSRQIIRFLKTKHVKAIVIACNTATAQALEELQRRDRDSCDRRDPTLRPELPAA